MATVELDIEIPTREGYERLAYEYMATLPLEHYMEGNPNALQRKITVESFDLVTPRRPEVQVANEMLVQYPRPDGRNGQVVPDNMVVLRDRPFDVDMSFNVALEPAGIFMVLEYVSRGIADQRKEYQTNRLKYERELKVPYYLLFDPLAKKLTFLELVDDKYRNVARNASGRFPIPELDMELALLDGWVRFWYEGELLLLPAELMADIQTLLQRMEKEKERADQQQARADKEAQRAEQEKQRAADSDAKAARLAEKLRALGIDPDA